MEEETDARKKAAVRSAEKDRISTCEFADRVARASIAEYQQRNRGVHYEQTVLAAFLVHDAKDDSLVVLSLGVGTKVLSQELVESDELGERVRDCHAEVLARRSLLRTLYSDVEHLLDDQYRSDERAEQLRSRSSVLLSRGQDGGKLRLGEGKTLHLYSSSQPCGNATLKRWAKGAKERYDETLRGWCSAHHQRMQVQARNEGQVALLAKCSRPGAAGGAAGAATCDREGTIAPGTCEPGSGGGNSMSCSDKIAKWSCLGVQGSLLTRWVEPIFITSCTVGRKYSRPHLERAICCRLQDFTQFKVAPLSELAGGAYGVRHIAAMCTSIKLDTGAICTEVGAGARFEEGACLAWSAGDDACEAIVGRTGLAASVMARDETAGSIAKVSKRSLFRLYEAAARIQGSRLVVQYGATKKEASDYQMAKELLLKKEFSAWQRAHPMGDAFLP